MIVTDYNKLKIPIEPTEFKQSEPEVIAAALFTELDKHDGLGLSANQIGLDKRICVIKVKNPIFLVNPVIVEESDDKIMYLEGCLSIPKTLKKSIKTIRSKSITIAADNYEGTLLFEPDNSEDEWSMNSSYFWGDQGLLESITVQHEIDHLNGITIRDRAYVPSNEKVNKINRNQRVMFTNPENGDIQFLKWKHGQSLIAEGWEVKI